MRIRNAIYGLVMLFAVSSMAGSAEPRKVELRLWDIPPKASMDVNGKADRAVFDLFLKNNPDIEVKALVPLKIQGRGEEGNEFLAIAGNMAPDVFNLFARKTGNYIDQGFLEPLNKYFENDFSGNDLQYSGVDAPFKIWDLAIRDEKIYAVPYFYFTTGLMYRKDLFLKYGLDPKRPPRNWDEIWEMGKKLTHLKSKETDGGEEKNVYGFSIWRPAQGWYYQQLVWANGGDVVRSYKKCPKCGEFTPVNVPYFPYSKYGIRPLNLGDYENKYSGYQEKCLKCGCDLAGVKEIKWRLVTNEDPGVEALEFFRKLATQEWLRCTGKHDRREFDITPEMRKTGTAACPVCSEKYFLDAKMVKDRIYKGIIRASEGGGHAETFEMAMRMMVIGNFAYTDFNLYSVVPFPSSRKDSGKPFVGGSYYGINKTSPPERQKAAWRYIKFMTGEEAHRVWVKVMVENGMYNYVRPILLKKYGYMDYYNELSKDWIDINDAASSAEVEPYCKGYANVLTLEYQKVMDMAVLYPELKCRDLMDNTCKEVNRMILDKRPESEMRKYDLIAYVAIGVAFALISLAFAYIIKVKMKGQEVIVSSIPGMSRRRRTLYAWSFLSVAVVSIAIWQYYPLVRGSIMAFQDFNILTGGTFVGPRNFIEVLMEKNFYLYLYQTFLYVVLTIVMGFLIPFFLAILLTEVPKGKILFRTLYYLPAVTTGLVTLFLWKQLLYDPSPDGIVNWFLGLIGISPQTFLEDPAMAMVCLIIPGIWAGAGPGCLIYLAAMKCIPEDQYEAAEMDGAGFMHKLIHIMIPNLKGLLMINLLGAFVGAFHASENIFVMTGGGPVNGTMTIGLDIWFNSFLYLNFGFATAEAWILGAMLIGFTVLQLQTLSKMEFKTANSIK